MANSDDAGITSDSGGGQDKFLKPAEKELWNGELPITQALKHAMNGVDNQGFQADEAKSPVDEESKTSFLPATKTANGLTSADKDDEKGKDGEDDGAGESDDDPDMVCGVGTCRPQALQRLRTMGCFTVSYSIAGVVTSALNIYINSQITTLEKHFNFSSSISGFLMSCNDLGYLSTTLFMSYYTRRVHVPRTLAICCIIYGLSGLVCTIPFFGTRDQLPSPPHLSKNDSSAKSSGFAQMCVNMTSYDNATCEELSLRTKSAFHVSDQWRVAAIAVLAAGMILQGVAKSPRQPFLGTYVDDNVPKAKTTMYLGVMIGLSIFGPAVAFTLGGVFSQMYITLEETNLNIRDPRWLGAWWLGFIIFGSCGLIVGLPLIFFPKKMRKQVELEVIKRREEMEKRGKANILHEVKGVVKAVLRLAFNPIYVCVVLGTGINLMGVSGMIAFMPKYLETQFTIPASQANMLLGAVNVFAASMGTILGGCLTSRFKLSPTACLKVLIGCMITSTAVLSLGFFVGCDQPQIYTGHQDSRHNNSGSLQCVQGCGCDQQNFFPVCGSDQRNYFSPCHAGCKSMDKHNTFTKCSCLATSEFDTATGGLCEPSCKSLYPYIVFTFLGGFLSTVLIMPSFVVSVRCVKEADKPLAIGFGAFSGTLIGWFPGPVIFGLLIDTTCLIWNTTCTSQGACWLYNIAQFRFRMHALMVGLRVVTTVFFIIAFFIALCSKTVKFQPHVDMEVKVTPKTPTNRMTEKEKHPAMIYPYEEKIRETDI